MKSKIDIRNITKLREYFSTYSDPKKKISLSDERSYKEFIGSLHLKEKSLFCIICVFRKRRFDEKYFQGVS